MTSHTRNVAFNTGEEGLVNPGVGAGAGRGGGVRGEDDNKMLPWETTWGRGVVGRVRVGRFVKECEEGS